MNDHEEPMGFGCLVLLLAMIFIPVAMWTWFEGAFKRHPEAVAAGVMMALPGILIALLPSRRT